MSKVNIGWVGAGFVGQSAHLEHFINFQDCSIIGLADLRPLLAEKACASFDIPKTFYNHTDLLKCHEIDAVVAIVNRRHTFQVAKDILQSGRHLLTEKPMASTYDAAYELVDLAEKKGLIYSAGFMRRYDSGVKKFKSMLHDLKISKELGNILSIRLYVEAGKDYCGIQPRITTTEKRPTPKQKNIAPHWIPDEKKMEYESFVNVCTHDINLLRFLFDETPSISFVDYRPNGFSYALMDFGPFPGIFEWGLRSDDNDSWKEGVEIRFEKGQLSLILPPAFLRNVSAKITIRRDSSSIEKESSIKTVENSYDWSFYNSDKAFLNAVMHNQAANHAGKLCLADFNLIDDIWRNIVDK